MIRCTKNLNFDRNNKSAFAARIFSQQLNLVFTVAQNKKKIINDPVHGFITIPTGFIFDVMEHRYFQRLRRIRQLGLTDYVYLGAMHTRFHHAIGAMHLMGIALQTLREKGHSISDDEWEAAHLAILLHDVGHSPFSHALEHSLLHNIAHEKVSLLIMEKLHAELGGNLGLAIEIFKDTYPRRFFHELVSGQFDVDRLDYLCRDSFFTGVTEGNVGASQILRMLEIHEGHLVIEEKGIYSIEHFIGARRLMYWQVYFHKTTVVAEQMLIRLISRARWLAQRNELIAPSKYMQLFLSQDISLDIFMKEKQYLEAYLALDDTDVWACIKDWTTHPDAILALLANSILDRKVFRINISNEAFSEKYLQRISTDICQAYQIGEKDLQYLMPQGQITNAAYMGGDRNIKILMKNGKITDLAQATDLPNIEAMRKIVKKYYVCSPKNISLRD